MWEGEQRQGYSAFPTSVIRTGAACWGRIAACLFTTYLSILCTLGLVQVPVVHITGDSWLTAQLILLDWVNELLSQSSRDTLVLLTLTTVWWRWECYCSAVGLLFIVLNYTTGNEPCLLGTYKRTLFWKMASPLVSYGNLPVGGLILVSCVLLPCRWIRHLKCDAGGCWLYHIASTDLPNKNGCCWAHYQICIECTGTSKSKP